MSEGHSVPSEFDRYGDQPPGGDGSATGKDGILEASFATANGETYLAHDFARTPCHLTGTLEHDDPLPGIASIYIQTPTAGIVQGDRQCVQIDVAPDARAHVSTQSATKVFSMDRSYGRMRTDLTVDDGGFLEYLPEPTILHEDARYAATCSLDVGLDATVIIGDIIVPGRLARGEAFDYDQYYSRFEARTGGQLVVNDAVHLDADDPSGPGEFGEYNVLGTLYVVSPMLDTAAASDRLHERLDHENIRSGVTALPDDSGVVVRALGHRASDVTDRLDDARDEVRRIVFGVGAPDRRKY